MSVRVLLEGIDELRAALHQLPEDLNQEARSAVVETAEEAARDLRASYPEKLGELRAGVKVRVEQSPVWTRATVRSTAKEAHWWEFGTVNRKTERGWDRGRMEAQYNRGLVGIAARKRRVLQQTLWAIVERAGFTVSGG